MSILDIVREGLLQTGLPQLVFFYNCYVLPEPFVSLHLNLVQRKWQFEESAKQLSVHRASGESRGGRAFGPNGTFV